MIFIWFKLPFTIKYHSEIKYGNKFVENVVNYKRSRDSLPMENDWNKLEELNPIKPYESWWPTYHKIDDSTFTLTFMDSFDGPYLTYDSRTKNWQMK